MQNLLFLTVLRGKKLEIMKFTDFNNNNFLGETRGFFQTLMVMSSFRY